MKKTAYAGVDYHVKSVAVSVVAEKNNGFYDDIRLKNEDRLILKYFKKLSKKFELKICYEASSSGYIFQRKAKKWGYHCDVIAPSLIPRKPGDRRKNDFRDARKLAEYYSKDQLTVVHPPAEIEESARSLIRCRLSMKENEKNTKRKINAFLLSKGHQRNSSKWTLKHREWLSALRFNDEYSQTVFDEFMGLPEYLGSRIKWLDEKIEVLAESETYSPIVKKLCAFKGIATLTAMLLIAEITDFRRFPAAGSLMSFLGLIPGEDSSSDRHKSRPITETGNTRCRTLLTESVQHCMKNPRITLQMKKNLAQVDANSSNIAVKCMKRLHKRYWALVMKGKSSSKAKTAVAGEFVGFIWAMMQPVESPAPA